MNFLKENLTEKEEQSIIAYLLKYDEIIKNFFTEIRLDQAASSEVQMFCDEINPKIIDAFEEIRTEMANRLKNMMNFILESKNKIINDAFQFRNEIDILTKENSTLIKEIEDLKVQITKMENTIGQNEVRQMYFTK